MGVGFLTKMYHPLSAGTRLLCEHLGTGGPMVIASLPLTAGRWSPSPQSRTRGHGTRREGGPHGRRYAACGWVGGRLRRPRGGLGAAPGDAPEGYSVARSQILGGKDRHEHQTRPARDQPENPLPHKPPFPRMAPAPQTDEEGSSAASGSATSGHSLRAADSATSRGLRRMHSK